MRDLNNEFYNECKKKQFDNFFKYLYSIGVNKIKLKFHKIPAT